jgi:uracil-DNA glycosylase
MGLKLMVLAEFYCIFDSMEVRIDSAWKKALQNEFSQPYFSSLVEFVKQEYQQHPGAIFPKGSQIFSAFEACPPEKVRVVILGQDPYPTPGHAHGLCFSVDASVRPLPRSLNNIYQELQSDLGIAPRTDGDLHRWAQQGVLLLNSVLTVRSGAPDSHAGKGWERFTDAVIQNLNAERTGVVYLLWGSKAMRKAENVDRQRNLILTAPHPSPLSAHRGFFGCRHFSKANEYLQTQGYEAIRW